MKATESIRLLKPTHLLQEAALDYRQEHFDAGEYIINGSALFDKTPDYSQWLEKVCANSCADTVDPNWVLTDTFFAVRGSDSRIVGIIDLRYQLNEFLQNLGNCGYSVRPSERKKGYATEMLRQVCHIAKEYGLPELKLSVEKGNAASIRTIEKNGGIFGYCFPFGSTEAAVYTIKLTP